MRQLEPGLYPDLDIVDYHERTEGLSSSAIKLLLDCPARYHYEYFENKEPADSKALLMGQAIHTLALEPELFYKRFHVHPKIDGRTKAGMALKEELAANYSEFQWINEVEFEAIDNMAQELKKNKFFSALLNKVDACIEHSVIWQDKQHNPHSSSDWVTTLKTRPDYFNTHLIVDLKSCESAEPHAFMRAANDRGYFIQAAMAIDGLNAHFGGNYKSSSFMFFCIEKKAPFITKIYYPSADAIEWGRSQYKMAIKIYNDCCATKQWPGYGDLPEEIDLQRYLKATEYL